jgi:uncharacterized protein (DUF2384 family)
MDDVIQVLLETTPHEAIERLGVDLGLSNEDVARAVNSSVRTIERWRSGQAYPQTAMRRRLGELVEFHRHLLETFATPDAARAWLHQVNRNLAGLTPTEVLRAGRLDRVEAALEALDSGIFV